MNPKEPMSETTGAGPAPATVPRVEDPPVEAPLNVLIIYEDALAMSRALRVISRLENQTGDQVCFKRVFWRFDLLEEPDWRGEAARDVVAADMVILATREAAELPPALNGWLEACLALRGEQGTALVALFGSSDIWSISLRDGAGFRTVRQTAGPIPETAVAVEQESLIEACV